MKKMIEKIITEKNIISIFVIIAICCFFGLVTISLCYTEVNVSFVEQNLTLQTMNQGMTIISVVLFLAFCKVLLYFIEKTECNKLDYLLVLTNVAVVGISLYMLQTNDFVPKYDQERIVRIASEFTQGIYDDFDPVQGYIGWFPHQLGLVSFMRFAQGISVTSATKVFQYFNIIMLVLLINSGYKMLEYIYPNRKGCKVLYLFLVLGCLPMYGYVPFIYGEIASTACAMFSMVMMISSLRNNNIYKMLTMWIAMALAIQFRKNVLICAVAVAIVLLVKCIVSKSKHAIIMLIGMLITIFVVQYGVDQRYDRYTADESFGIPSSLYIAMGLNDTQLGPGWYDAFSVRTYVYDANGDVDLANDLAKQHIALRLEQLTSSPNDFLKFYGHKMISQWSAPLYMVPTLYQINEFLDMPLYEYYFKTSDNILDHWADMYQLVIYGSVLVLLLMKARKQWGNLYKIESYTLLIAIVGGVLFSILWEANARYTVPYLLMMIPYAALGIDSICSIRKISK